MRVFPKHTHTHTHRDHKPPRSRRTSKSAGISGPRESVSYIDIRKPFPLPDGRLFGEQQTGYSPTV